MKSFAIAVIMGTSLLLGGCTTFQIKNTDGLMLAYEDIDRASSKGIELKMLSKISEEQRQKAADLYREAKHSVNAYLQSAIIDAADYKVDKNSDSYKATGIHEKVVEFQNKVNELRQPRIASISQEGSIVSLVGSTKQAVGSGSEGTGNKAVAEILSEVVLSAAPTWVPLAKDAIEEIVNLRKEEQKAAYERFGKIVNQYMMKDFEVLPDGGKE